MLWLKASNGVKPAHHVFMENCQPAFTVAMVSVPLSISLGIASVAGADPAAPTMGVATAFWGGICAGLFGSSDHNIVGPAGALSGMLTTYTIQYNGIGVLPYLSLLSACMIFVIYMLNLQRYALLMPKAVFEGFTLAVAFIIGLNQLNMAFDLQPVGPKHKHFYENVIESLKILDELSWAPAITFVFLTVLLLSLVKWVPKVKGRPIPWTVIIPLLTIILGYLSDSDNLGGIRIPTLKDKYGELKARVVVPPSQSLEHYAQGSYSGIFTAAFGIAFVAVLETLISAKIAEQKTGWGFDDSRETLGLMICHAVCGAVGAMPPTGVFVRTALNFSLGATHKMSQIVNALAVLVISVAVMPVFSYLPQSSVAALLIFASVRMAPVHYMVDLWKADKSGFGLLVFTCLICVFTDPVYGLILGMVFALLREASKTALAESRLSFYSGGADEENQEKQAVYSGESDQPPSMTCTVEVDRHDPQLSLRSSPVTAILGSLARSTMRSQGVEPFDRNVLDEASGCVAVYEPIGPLTYLTQEKHQARLKVLLERQPKAIVVSLDLTSRVDKDGSDALGKAMKQIAETDLQVERAVQFEARTSNLEDRSSKLLGLRGTFSSPRLNAPRKTSAFGVWTLVGVGDRF